MSSKTVAVEGVGDVVISKRRGQRSIRLSVNGNKVLVTQPSWLPYSAGESFLARKYDWIKTHHKPVELYLDGQVLKDGSTLKLTRSDKTKLTSKIAADNLIVMLPAAKYPEDLDVQKYISEQTTKLFRSKAENYLPKRTTELAELFNFSYKSVQVRQLKRRWGSCNSKKELVFNLNLITLDTLHIDYVILHELTHTIHMNHGAEFWSHMESVMPNSKKIAKAVRHYSL